MDDERSGVAPIYLVTPFLVDFERCAEPLEAHLPAYGYIVDAHFSSQPAVVPTNLQYDRRSITPRVERWEAYENFDARKKGWTKVILKPGK